ncbi:MAG: gliding motility protein GldN [Bacteroidetes bacterium]|nr:gliding motility protein GldN [Bacteroidota bacterium]MDA0943900.1 gliding motility protein GldN [Bacteroidota bacterium]MDA1112081.1 gliding motility protein GldN [Bacteroidota bacterium]
MRKIVFIFLLSFSLSAYAQDDWGGGWGSGGDWGSSSGDDKGSSGDGSSFPSIAEPVKPPEIIVPTIGTHYDDPAVAHYEPAYVENDGNTRIKQGVYIKRPPLREADVKMRRRVWRVIDVRQKMNKCWTWPKQPVTQVFWELATKGLVRAYATDSLNRILTPEDIIKATSKIVPTTVLIDEENEIEKDTYLIERFDWYNIQKFEIMEDWVFDYKHGDWKPIIIAIAPIIPETLGGRTFDTKEFWIKMDDCRPTLAKCEVYNRYNDAMRLNWDQQINLHRLFDSYIVKTTDWDDQYINMKEEFQQDPLAALLKGEKVKNDLFIFEHDLWEY